MGGGACRSGRRLLLKKEARGAAERGMVRAAMFAAGRIVYDSFM